MTRADRGEAARRAGALRIEYPDELPISARRDEIRGALEAHSVIVVCGDTGSGKTTQLPKICLEAGRGTRGMIGHTQPRRIAARAVAQRLASELGVETGGPVGYQVRFTDATVPGTRVKVMTDGILLNEIRTDRRLEAYDTVIVDEAHERSLNIDFLLGYLKRVLERRKGLKVIVTSATIDPERFAAHFGGAPILRIEGRAYPVEIRYAPRERGEDLADSVVQACHAAASIERVGAATRRESRPEAAPTSRRESRPEAAATPRESRRDAAPTGGHRDVLVFLPGERWIRDAEQALRKGGPPGFEILPLYSRLASRHQDRIFKPGKAPRIVLATNVAETSLTVPRIRFVIDSGLARIGRYSARHRVQGLGVEPIAQANAIQRAGRCGRLGPGLCIRLYSEEDLAQRAAFTDPEILRTNLAGVILRLEALRLGHIDEFPFLDTPPAKAVNDAYRLLHVLGAMDADRRLTKDGVLMGRLPLDPRLARLLLAGRAECLREALVIAAVLSVVDAREYPPEDLEAARAAHAKFADPRSDFTTYLNLWKAYRAERRRGARSFRTWCAEHYLSPARLREWDDVHAQLFELVTAFGWRIGREEADARSVHRAVLAAFVDFVAQKWEGGIYRGMYDARAALFPGSPPAARIAPWIVAAEHVATGRSYLRTVAQINPRWVTEVAPHLLKRDYQDPLWDAKRGRVTVREVISIFGLVLSADRRVDYGSIDPADARRIFIRDALVAGDLGANLTFLESNRAVKQTILDWEARLRSRDLFIGDRGLEAFYAERLPEQIRDRHGLVVWCRVPAQAASLEIEASDLTTRDIGAFDAACYPGTLTIAGQSLPLQYRYEPGDERDGITLRLPAVLVGAVRAEQLDWLIPAWLGEKVLAMLRALSKDLRRKLVPLPDTVKVLLPNLAQRTGRQALGAALRDALAETRGIVLEPSAFNRTAVPPHLRIYVEVIDEQRRVIARGRDVRALQRELGAAAAAVPAAAVLGAIGRQGLRRWDCGILPARAPVEQYGSVLELYPALVDVGGRVDLTLLPPGPAAVERHRCGVRRLLLASLPQQAALVRNRVLGDKALLLGFLGVGSGAALVDDVLCAAADQSFAVDPPIRDAAAFDRCLTEGRGRFVPAAEALLMLAADVTALGRQVRRRLGELRAGTAEAARRDIEAQLGNLLQPGFLAATPPAWRVHLSRYLKAILARCDKLGHPKDGSHQAQIETAWTRYLDWRASLPPDWPEPEAMTRYRWLIEEFRVSLYAQPLGTAVPVSAKRLEEVWRSSL